MMVAGAKKKGKTSAASKKSKPKKVTAKVQSKRKASPEKSPAQRRDEKTTPEKGTKKIDDNAAHHKVNKPRFTEEDLEQLREKIKSEETLIKGLKATVKNKKYDGMRNGPQKVARSLRDSMKILSETRWYEFLKIVLSQFYNNTILLFSDYSRFLGPRGGPDVSLLDDVQNELKLAAAFTDVEILQVKKSKLENGSTKVEIKQQLNNSEDENNVRFTVAFQSSDRVSANLYFKKLVINIL